MGNPVGVVHQSVQPGIREDGVSDYLMPVPDRKLAGDDGRGAPMAVFDHFQMVSPFGIGQRGQS